MTPNILTFLVLLVPAVCQYAAVEPVMYFLPVGGSYILAHASEDFLSKCNPQCSQLFDAQGSSIAFVNTIGSWYCTDQVLHVQQYISEDGTFSYGNVVGINTTVPFWGDLQNGLPYNGELSLNIFISNGYTPNYDVFAVTWDWRLDNQALDELGAMEGVRLAVEQLSARTSKKVNFFGFSGGGFMELYFLNVYVDAAWKNQYIARAVFLSVPLGGIPAFLPFLVYSTLAPSSAIEQISALWNTSQGNNLTQSQTLSFAQLTEVATKPLSTQNANFVMGGLLLSSDPEAGKFLTSLPMTVAMTPDGYVWGGQPLYWLEGTFWTAANITDLISKFNNAHGGLLDVNENWLKYLSLTWRNPFPGVETHCICSTGVATGAGVIFNQSLSNPSMTYVINKDGDGTVPTTSCQGYCGFWISQGYANVHVHTVYNIIHDDVMSTQSVVDLYMNIMNSCDVSG